METQELGKVLWEERSPMIGRRVNSLLCLLFSLFPMKMVKKGQTIESVIIEQNPPTESLDITEEKLHKGLRDMGSRCLIILDGLDEYDLQDGDNLRKLIEGRKLPHCTLLVTSRPHNCEKIENYFSTKVKVNGFSQIQAEQFISKCLNHSDKIQAVSNLNTHNFRSQEGYSNPILLLFLCILENNGELDLTQKVISFGEVYFRLIRCMYRKYCVRKDIEFDDREFIQVLRRVGKVAWEMLDSGTNVAKQNEIIEEVGSDAFEYGLFAGHMDYRLMSKETKDIFVAFVHQNVQEFLGTFHCICLWNKEGKIHISDRFPPTESYFLRFCLWFLSDECTYVQFDKSEDILNALAEYVRDKIDFVQLDLNILFYLFPALEMRMSENLSFEFMKKVLSICKNVHEVYVTSNHATNQILEALGSSIPYILLVANTTVFDECDYIHFDDLSISEKELLVVERSKPYLGMTHVLKRFTSKPLSLVVLANHPEEDVEITDFCHEYLSKFSIGAQIRSHLTAAKFPSCFLLTELLISYFYFQEDVLKSISSAVEKKHFPVLNQLSFRSCGSSLKCKLHLLFNSTWPTLTHLSMLKCFLDSSDIQVLSLGTNREHCLLPNLTSLTIDISELLDTAFITLPFEGIRSVDCALFSMLKTSCRGLTSLFLHNVSKQEYQQVAFLINHRNFPSLTHIGVSMWSLALKYKMKKIATAVRGTKSTERLVPVNLSTITTLSLNRFVCAQTHLLTAAKSAKFSNVHELDISHSSHIAGKLFILVGHSFPSLSTLIVSDCGLNASDLTSLAEASAKSRLPELRHLDISQNSDIQGYLTNLFLFEQKWSQLLTLNIQQDPYSPRGDDLQVILNLVRSGRLGSLTEFQVSLSNVGSIEDYLGPSWCTLTTLQVWTTGDLTTRTSILKTVVDLVKKKLLPKLRQFRLISLIKRVEKEDLANSQLFGALLDQMNKFLNNWLITHFQTNLTEKLDFRDEENHVRAMFMNPTIRSALYSWILKKESIINGSFGIQLTPEVLWTFSDMYLLVMRYISGKISYTEVGEIIKNHFEAKKDWLIRQIIEIIARSDAKRMLDIIITEGNTLQDIEYSVTDSLWSVELLRQCGVRVFTVHNQFWPITSLKLPFT